MTSNPALTLDASGFVQVFMLFPLGLEIRLRAEPVCSGFSLSVYTWCWPNGSSNYFPSGLGWGECGACGK